LFSVAAQILADRHRENAAMRPSPEVSLGRDPRPA
jgi:hypothetical protein